MTHTCRKLLKFFRILSAISCNWKRSRNNVVSLQMFSMCSRNIWGLFLHVFNISTLSVYGRLSVLDPMPLCWRHQRWVFVWRHDADENRNASEWTSALGHIFQELTVTSFISFDFFHFSPVWDVIVSSQHGYEELQILSRVTAKFSVGPWVTSAGSPVDQAPYSILVDVVSIIKSYDFNELLSCSSFCFVFYKTCLDLSFLQVNFFLSCPKCPTYVARKQ